MRPNSEVHHFLDFLLKKVQINANVSVLLWGSIGFKCVGTLTVAAEAD